MKDTIPPRGRQTDGRGRQTDGVDTLDLFAPEREARARDDTFEFPDAIHPDRYANEMPLPWHDDSADAMRRAAFLEWRNRLFKLCLAGVLLSGTLFLVPLLQSASIASLWAPPVEPQTDETAAAAVPIELPPGPDASTPSAPVVEPPVVPSPPDAPTEQALGVAPLPVPADPLREPDDPPSTTPRSEPSPQLRKSDPAAPIATPPSRTTVQSPIVRTPQGGRTAGASNQTTRPPLEPPLSQRGLTQTKPTDVSRAGTAGTTGVPASAPRTTDAPSTAAVPTAGAPGAAAAQAAPPLSDPTPTAASRPPDSVAAGTPRAPDPPPSAAATGASSSPQRNVPLIGERNVPLVRDRNVPIVGDRNVPRPADPTAAPPADTPASRPASAAPVATPPAAASAPTAPPPPPATPAPSTAPVPPPSTAAAAPSSVAAAATPRSAPPAPASPPAAAAAAPPRPAVSAAAPALELDRREINGALARYKGAFNALDARAAASIWPTVDRDTLARAFQRLKQQEVTFDDCQIDVKEVRANATCSGTLRFVPRVGASTPQVGRRQWTFSLAKVRDEWVIQSVDTR